MDQQTGLSKAILQDRLPDLAQVHYYEELPSTNDLGKQLVAENTDLPALIYARNQTSGRGRGGKTWASNTDSATFTFLVDVNQLAGDFSSFSSPHALSWGLAIANALNMITHSKALFQVKWPNDVVAKDRKVAGVLIESVVSNPSVSIVGIGVNVFGDSDDLGVSENGTLLPISVYEASGVSVSKVDVISSIWDEFGKTCQLNEKSWQSQFHQVDYLVAKSLTLQQGSKQYCGRYLGLDSDARIRLQTDQGEILLASGSVVYAKEDRAN